MEACPKTELIAIEDPATVCDGSLAIGEGREAQMIRHMRHGSPPRLMAPQPTLSLPSAPTVGNPLRPLQPETVSLSASLAILTKHIETLQAELEPLRATATQVAALNAALDAARDDAQRLRDERDRLLTQIMTRQPWWRRLVG